MQSLQTTKRPPEALKPLQHPQTIFVTSLYEMPHFVRELRPSRVVSIIQPELQPDRPGRLAAAAHLRVAVHDISDERPFHVLPEREHVEALVRFIDAWSPEEGALLTHCYAGVSRSTAAALIAAAMKTGDPHWSALRLRAASPHAAPNRRIISLADDVLGLGGRLREACDAMGESAGVVEGPLTVLRIGEQQKA
ncbi:MAG: protein tyrosine phosphatase [Pseudomonadota bacterium]